MAFSTYEEFRAACADPKRVLTVDHSYLAQACAASAASSTHEGYIAPTKLFTSGVALSTGGAVLNHTSVSGSTLGTVGIPIRKPLVEGRSWHLFNIECDPHVSATSVTLFDALWAGSFTSSVATVTMPALTRHADGRNVVCTLMNKHSSSATAYNGAINVTVETFAGTPVTIVAGTEKASVSSSPIFVTGLSSGIVPLTQTKSASGAGRGGVKKVTSLAIDNGLSMFSSASIWMLKELVSIPCTVIDPGRSTTINRPYIAAPQYLMPRPFVRLAPGTDGNFACIIPILGKNRVEAWTATQVINLRLQFVEG